MYKFETFSRNVIILGDLNTSHRPIDTCDSSGPEYATNPCRKWFNRFIFDSHLIEAESSGKFVDAFRFFHPDAKEAFTCWSTATGARQTNYGCRIDYTLGDKDLVQSHFRNCDISPHVQGSDHCPVIAEVDLPIIAAEKCPSLCAKWMPEFAGRQRKMQDFFKKHQPEVVAVKSPDSDLEIIELNSPRKKLRLTDSAVQTVDKSKKVTVPSKKPPNKKGFQMTLQAFVVRKSVEEDRPAEEIQNSDQVSLFCRIADTVLSEIVVISYCTY